MTFATKLTVLRLVLVPVFAFLAISYGLSTAAGTPDETLRWAAFWVFVTAAATDGIDGWIARHFNQKSDLGAFLDPIADKALVLSALLILTFLDWGVEGWHIPLWFAALVVLRDSVILAGIRVMWSARKKV
jgi:cardiolipin synthase (CMP-forming)